MAMTQRTIFELRCDIQVCTSVVSGPSHQMVMDTAFRGGGWTTAPVQFGHGKTEVIYRCPTHGDTQ
jgi:hypothetical protein